MTVAKALTETMLANRFFALLDTGVLRNRAEAFGTLMIFWHAAYTQSVYGGSREALMRLIPGPQAVRAAVFSALLDVGYVTPLEGHADQFEIAHNGLYAKTNLARDLRVRREAVAKAALQAPEPEPASVPEPEPEPPAGLFAAQPPQETPEEAYERTAARTCFAAYAQAVRARCGQTPKPDPQALGELRQVVRRLGVEQTKACVQFFVADCSEPHLVRERWPLRHLRQNMDSLSRMTKVAVATRRGSQAALAH